MTIEDHRKGFAMNTVNGTDLFGKHDGGDENDRKLTR